MPKSYFPEADLRDLVVIREALNNRPATLAVTAVLGRVNAEIEERRAQVSPHRAAVPVVAAVIRSGFALTRKWSGGIRGDFHGTLAEVGVEVESV